MRGSPSHFVPGAQVWDLKMGDVAAGDVVKGTRLTRTLEGHVGVLSGVRFRADGAVLASCDMDGQIRLWHSGGGWDCLVTCTAGSRQARAAVFGEGESIGLFMCCDEAGRVRMWDTAGIMPLCEIPPDEQLTAEDPEEESSDAMTQGRVESPNNRLCAPAPLPCPCCSAGAFLWFLWFSWDVEI